MARRRLLILVAGCTVFVSLVILLVLHPWDQPVQQVLSANQSLVYTNDVTGASGSDLPQESGSIAAGFVAPPRVDIEGLDALDAYLTDDQAQNIEQTLKNFLTARSGLSVVDAGILNRQILQSNNNLSFTLVVDRPQATYHVTIDTSNSQSLNVSWEQVE